MAVTAHHRRRHGQRVENGFFRGFDRRRDQGVQVCVGKMHLLKRRLFGIVGDDVRRGRRRCIAPGRPNPQLVLRH